MFNLSNKSRRPTPAMIAIDQFHDILDKTGDLSKKFYAIWDRVRQDATAKTNRSSSHPALSGMRSAHPSPILEHGNRSVKRFNARPESSRTSNTPRIKIMYGRSSRSPINVRYENNDLTLWMIFISSASRCASRLGHLDASDCGTLRERVRRTRLGERRPPVSTRGIESCPALFPSSSAIL